MIRVEPADPDAILAFAYRIYADDPAWVPPARPRAQRLLQGRRAEALRCPPRRRGCPRLGGHRSPRPPEPEPDRGAGPHDRGARGRAPLLAGHHPARYRRLFEDAGFVKHHDVLAYDAELLDSGGRPRPLPAALQAAASAVDIPGLELRSPRIRSLRGDIGLAHTCFVEAFRDVPDKRAV